jgi:non-specific serine/threonine protein kinase
MERASDKSPNLLIEPLTRRERKILTLLEEGLTNREMAEAETLALSTVKWYVRQIYGKLGVNNRREALAVAREAGLLTPSSETRPKHNLPYQLTGLIGREEEVTQVKALMAKSRLVTLTGTGGVGKTRLCLQVAEEMLTDYAHGVWLVELAPLSDPKLVFQAVATVLEVREGPGAPLSASLIEYLRSRQTLLVLDNCEHLIEACARLAETILQTCHAVHILATSREALRIMGEAVYDVPSLPYPDAQDLAGVENASQYAAVRLFEERARAVQAGFRINDANLACVANICRRLDGIPLAIELAAARVEILSVEQIAGRLRDAFRLLAGGTRTALPRHQTLRALIEWSYDLLTEAEKTLFASCPSLQGAGDWKGRRPFVHAPGSIQWTCWTF